MAPFVKVKGGSGVELFMIEWLINESVACACLVMEGVGGYTFNILKSWCMKVTLTLNWRNIMEDEMK